jgi:predicted PhzF superfamily epimerase YddE/YHI9
MPTLQFSQVNVFSADSLSGNPLAVVHAAEKLGEALGERRNRWASMTGTSSRKSFTSRAA